MCTVHKLLRHHIKLICTYPPYVSVILISTAHKMLCFSICASVSSSKSWSTLFFHPSKEKNRRVGFSHVLEIEYTRTQANSMRFLHKDVRIVEFELGHMIANEFRLQRDQLQDQLRPLTFFFSQKV